MCPIKTLESWIFNVLWKYLVEKYIQRHWLATYVVFKLMLNGVVSSWSSLHWQRFHISICSRFSIFTSRSSAQNLQKRSYISSRWKLFSWNRAEHSGQKWSEAKMANKWQIKQTFSFLSIPHDHSYLSVTRVLEALTWPWAERAHEAVGDQSGPLWMVLLSPWHADPSVPVQATLLQEKGAHCGFLLPSHSLCLNCFSSLSLYVVCDGFLAKAGQNCGTKPGRPEVLSCMLREFPAEEPEESRCISAAAKARA